jgi:hypothetical protein
MKYFVMLGGLGWWLASATGMAADSIPVKESRGELLYSANCQGCHNEQVHWRDKKLAKDWATLVEEVRHWQEFSKLNWDEHDIAAVSRYLNALHYHYDIPLHQS